MPEAERLTALIADIYDTAFNAASWPQVLERICAFVPGCGCNLFSQDTSCDIAQVHYSWGDNPQYVQSYLNTYIKMNPFFPAISFDEVGRVGVQSDIVPFAEFHETRFYREWAKPQGYVDCLYCVLEKSATGCAMITVRRDARDGLVDEESRRRMRLVAPHVRRAVGISRALEHSQAATANLSELLDKMAAAIFLIGTDGRVTHVNKAAETLLAQNDVLSKSEGILTIANQPSALALGDGNGGNGGVAVPLAGTRGERYVAHVLPLTSGARRQIAQSFAATSAVFVRKATVGWTSPTEMVARLYKLTPSEVRVLLAVAERERSVPQLAAALGLSADTVKTHLRHIFEKTGKRRKTDLIRLLAEFNTAP